MFGIFLIAVAIGNVAVSADQIDIEEVKKIATTDIVETYESYAVAQGLFPRAFEVDLLIEEGFLARGSYAAERITLDPRALEEDEDLILASIQDCRDRVAVFVESDELMPDDSDQKWWDDNGCTTPKGMRYFALSSGDLLLLSNPDDLMADIDVEDFSEVVDASAEEDESSAHTEEKNAEAENEEEALVEIGGSEDGGSVNVDATGSNKKEVSEKDSVAAENDNITQDGDSDEVVTPVEPEEDLNNAVNENEVEGRNGSVSNNEADSNNSSDENEVSSSAEEVDDKEGDDESADQKSSSEQEEDPAMLESVNQAQEAADDQAQIEIEEEILSDKNEAEDSIVNDTVEDVTVQGDAIDTNESPN